MYTEEKFRKENIGIKSDFPSEWNSYTTPGAKRN